MSIEVYPLNLYVSPEKANIKSVMALRGCHVNVKFRDGTVMVNVLLLDVVNPEMGDAELLYQITNRRHYKRIERFPIRYVESVKKIPDWMLE